jgi:hypothetical protein
MPLVRIRAGRRETGVSTATVIDSFSLYVSDFSINGQENQENNCKTESSSFWDAPITTQKRLVEN